MAGPASRAAGRPLDEDERRTIAAAEVPPLWASELGAHPRLSGWGGSGITLRARRAEVGTRWIANRDWDLVGAARDALERDLSWEHGRRGAARAVLEAAPREVETSAEGRPLEEAVLVASHGRWAFVGVDRRPTFCVEASGSGEPPARLTFVEAFPDVERPAKEGRR